jgi:hypothetical protein
MNINCLVSASNSAERRWISAKKLLNTHVFRPIIGDLKKFLVAVSVSLHHCKLRPQCVHFERAL